jgi:hypothetical protein
VMTELTIGLRFHYHLSSGYLPLSLLILARVKHGE